MMTLTQPIGTLQLLSFLNKISDSSGENQGNTETTFSPLFFYLQTTLPGVRLGVIGLDISLNSSSSKSNSVGCSGLDKTK
jgi:hypothetical protein